MSISEEEAESKSETSEESVQQALMCTLSKYGVFSGPHFPVFGLNTEIYYLNLRIQSEYRKIRSRKYSIFRHFSRSEDEDGVKSYNEKFLNLICTSTDVIQQIICLIHFVKYETNL